MSYHADPRFPLYVRFMRTLPPSHFSAVQAATRFAAALTGYGRGYDAACQELLDAAFQGHSAPRRYLMSTPCWEHECQCDGVGCAFTSTCPRRAYWYEGDVCTDSPHYMMSEARALSKILDNPSGDVARAAARADSSLS